MRTKTFYAFFSDRFNSERFLLVQRISLFLVRWWLKATSFKWEYFFCHFIWLAKTDNIFFTLFFFVLFFPFNLIIHSPDALAKFHFYVNRWQKTPVQLKFKRQKRFVFHFSFFWFGNAWRFECPVSFLVEWRVIRRCIRTYFSVWSNSGPFMCPFRW